MKLLKIMLQIFSVFLLIFCVNFGSSSAYGQAKKKEVIPDSCELISGKLSLVGAKFKELGENDSYLVIIGGAVKTEKSAYNKNRILDAIKYFVELHKIKTERVVSGFGTRSNELGYLRFYVNGKLITEINTVRKAKLCFGPGEIFNSGGNSRRQTG